MNQTEFDRRFHDEPACLEYLFQLRWPNSKTEDKDSILPGIHLVASLVKRLILGTFQGRFDKKYLQRYLDEYVFRFNRRTTKTVGKRFWRIIQQAVATPPLTNVQIASGTEIPVT